MMAVMASASSVETPVQTLILSAPEWPPDTNEDVVQQVRARYRYVHQFLCHPISFPLDIQLPLPDGLLPPSDTAAATTKRKRKRASSSSSNEDLVSSNHLRAEWQAVIEPQSYRPFDSTAYVCDADPQLLGIFGQLQNPLIPICDFAVQHNDKLFFTHYVLAVVLQFYAVHKRCFLHVRTDSDAAQFSEARPPWLLVLMRGTDCMTAQPIIDEEQDEDEPAAAAAAASGSNKRGRPPKGKLIEYRHKLSSQNVLQLLDQLSFPSFLLCVFRWIEKRFKAVKKLMHAGKHDAALALCSRLHANFAGHLAVDSHFRELIPTSLAVLLREHHDVNIMPSLRLNHNTKQTEKSVKVLSLNTDRLPRFHVDRLPLIFCHQTFSPVQPILVLATASKVTIADLHSTFFFVPRCEIIKRHKDEVVLASQQRPVKNRDSYTFFVDTVGIARVTIPRLLETTRAIQPGHLPHDDLSIAAMSEDAWEWNRTHGATFDSAINAFIHQRDISQSWKLVSMQSVTIATSDMAAAAAADDVYLPQESEARSLTQQVQQFHPDDWHLFARCGQRSNFVWIYQRATPLNEWQKELIRRAVFTPPNHPLHHLSAYWFMRTIEHITGREADGIASVAHARKVDFTTMLRLEQEAMDQIAQDIKRSQVCSPIDMMGWDLCATPIPSSILSVHHTRRWHAIFPASVIHLLAAGSNLAEPWNRLIRASSSCPILDSTLDAVVNLFSYNQHLLSELNQVDLDSLPSDKRASLRAIASFVMAGPAHHDARTTILSKVGMPAMKSSSMQSPVDTLERILQCEKQMNGFVSHGTLDYCYRRIAEAVPDTDTSVSICRSFRDRFASQPTTPAFAPMFSTPIKAAAASAAASAAPGSARRLFHSPPPMAATVDASSSSSNSSSHGISHGISIHLHPFTDLTTLPDNLLGSHLPLLLQPQQQQQQPT
jgi:hypothetical protein